MSPHCIVKVICFFLMLLRGFSSLLFSEEIGDTEIQFLDIQASNKGFGLEVRFILTANQYVQRITMENSYDLNTWQTSEIYPDWEFDVEGKIAFLSTSFDRTFYRAGIVLPRVALVQDSVLVANGRQSDPVVFGFSDPAFPFEFPELEVVSSNPSLIPQENIHLVTSTFSSSIQVTPTFDGVGDVPVDLIITGPDGVAAKATLLVIVLEGSGIAPEIADFYDAVLERKFPGFDYIFSAVSPSQRFIRNGEPGNWFYILDSDNGADKAILGFSYDKTSNDFTQYSELLRLTFVTDRAGNYEYVEVINNIEQNKSGGTFDLDTFTVFGAGAAPTEAAFARMAVGKHIINSAWTFDSATRFNYTEPNGGTPEPGNWKYVMTGEKTGRVTLTYDEDNNNASVYREEVDLTFETLETGNFIYREYFGSALNNTFPGVFDFTDE